MADTHPISIAEKDLPADLVWDTPPQNQGQIVVVSYGRRGDSRTEACSDSDFQRVVDHSEPVSSPDRVRFYQRTRFRAYDTTTEWMGPVRLTADAADSDAVKHNRAMKRQGGYGTAIVVHRGNDDRCYDVDGEAVWPPHGKSTGAVRFAA